MYMRYRVYYCKLFQYYYLEIILFFTYDLKNYKI